MSDRTRNAVVAAVVLGIMVVAVGVGVFIANRHHDHVDTSAVAPVGGPTSSASGSADPAASSAPGSHEVVIGPADAPHTVIIYEDFLCPYCDELETATHTELASLAAQGKVRVSYRPFDLLGFSPQTGKFDVTSYSVRAAAAFATVLQESGPAVAKKFHDYLYAHQPSEEGPFPDNEALAKDALAAGDTSPQLVQAIETGTQLNWVIDATNAASKAGVHSTPTVLVDGQPFDDARTVPELAQQLLTAVS